MAKPRKKFIAAGNPAGANRAPDSAANGMGGHGGQSTASALKIKPAAGHPLSGEDLFRAVFQAAPLGIAIGDPEGYFVEVNDAFYNLLGYGKNDITKLTFIDITHPADRRETIRLSGRVRRGESSFYQTQKRYLTKDGRYIWGHVRVTAIRDKSGRIQFWLGIIEDITGHKRTLEALRDGEEKYRHVLESIAEGYFELDLAGNFTFFNEALCEISGYSRDELMGMNNREYTRSDMAQKMYQRFSQLYRTGRPARGDKYEIITKNGSRKILEVSAFLMRDADQNPVGFRGVLKDLTADFKALEEKERLAAQIQQVQKMEAIGTLAGGIAHDFNNLLMGFQGNVSLMLLDSDENHPHYDYLRNMEEYIQRGSELTRQILGFARGGKYEVKSTDLNDLLEKTAEMFERTRKEISVHKKFQENLWPVEVDRGQIEQVLLNLFVNAWQAMPGGGDLFLETAHVTLDKNGYDKPYAIVPGRYVRISVTDTGVGIDKKIQARIFEPFFTTKGVGRGTGLGLASAYGIIKNHNGIINVYSEVGHGSTFKIYLPASDKKAAGKRRRTQMILTGTETILLVDDEKMVADIGRELLKSLGYRVFTAANGKEALKIYRQHASRIDLVILDMIMPEMSGEETFKSLKKINPGIKVLLSSGYSIEGRASQIIKRGCNGFIQKPFNLKKISRKIREILDARQSPP